MGMELINGGDLKSLIKQRGKMSDSDSALIMKSILSALSYIHD